MGNRKVAGKSLPPPLQVVTATLLATSELDSFLVPAAAVRT